MLFEIILILFGLYLLWFVRDRTKYHGYPPGPWRFPILGNFPQLLFKSPLPSTALRQLSDKYGDVMFVQMGIIDTVVFSSYSSLMELWGLDVSSNRKSFKYSEERNMGRNVGVIFSNGSTHQCLRRFTIRSLREFGFGKLSSMDYVINEEAEKFVAGFKTLVNSSPHGVLQVNHDLFDAATINVLWRLVTGKSYELNDERVIKMLQLNHAFVKSTRVDDISLCYPFLRNWFPNWTGRNLQMECIKNLNSFLDEVVREHEKQDDFDNPQCFIDSFLKMIEKEKGKHDTDFNHNQIVYILLDLFQAGSETSSIIFCLDLDDIESREVYT